MSEPSASHTVCGHEVLAAVLQVRDDRLHVLLWRRAIDPDAGAWSLPGGDLAADEHLGGSIRRQLAEKVDVRELAHLEQLDSRGRPERVPDRRVVATSYLGLVPVDADPQVPDDTAWHPTDALPRTAFDHGEIVRTAVARLRSKLSYTNLGFALAPPEFTMSELVKVYRAALGHDVDPTNLQRILVRRGQIEATGSTARHGPGGGRPAAIYRFTARALEVTDPFAVLGPPRG
ncbi:NUDIX hydrolase [Cellulomonas citrea]|uniref:NUDIX hydrolase n=1 Tax=Cellulomonas citrea TaxID=1909423 RepID=UPI00135974DF|nr:NUDIX domain-containing protein [Cellulomonas citrea]